MLPGLDVSAAPGTAGVVRPPQFGVTTTAGAAIVGIAGITATAADATVTPCVAPVPPVASKSSGSKKNPKMSHQASSSHPRQLTQLPPSPIKVKNYSKIDPHSTTKLNVIEKPSKARCFCCLLASASIFTNLLFFADSNSSLFSYELPSNRTHSELNSLKKLEGIQTQLAPMDIRRIFKRYAQENSLRIPQCVANAGAPKER